MRRQVKCSLLVSLMLICVGFRAHAATTTCSYSFASGSGNSYLSYCVTVNGNVLEITTPAGTGQLGSDGEGYGVCNESPAQNYTDYGVSDTGNWDAAVLLSQTASSVKIARTTSDGNWTLTQTITQVPKTSSITVVMSLKNNQPIAHVAYLVRYADAVPSEPSEVAPVYGATLNSAFALTTASTPDGQSSLPGLQLQNVGIPQFGFWQGYEQNVSTGPNACAFAFNSGGFLEYSFAGSIEMAYVTNVPAHGSKTVTLSYRGM